MKDQFTLQMVNMHKTMHKYGKIIFYIKFYFRKLSSGGGSVAASQQHGSRFNPEHGLQSMWSFTGFLQVCMGFL